MVTIKNEKMKKQLLGSALLLSFFFVAFIPKDKGKTDEVVFSFKEIEKSVAKITDSLYAGKYEVSNRIYRYFESDLIKNNKTDLLKISRPDTLNWRDKLAYNEPLVGLYYRHPAYQNYPVVNISHEAAVLFCTWLTEKYNANPKRAFKKVVFRLPTENEWETAAKGGNNLSSYPWGERLQNKQFMCNYKVFGDECITYDTLSKKLVIGSNINFGVAGNLNDAADLTAPVNSYSANNFGLYNVCGNVAEMVQEKGVSRGGGWRSPGGDVRIKSKGHYVKSSSDLGFRYFMEILEK
jgi:formylglycine-generating enzyme required for sulfatase activity